MVKYAFFVSDIHGGYDDLGKVAKGIASIVKRAGLNSADGILAVIGDVIHAPYAQLQHTHFDYARQKWSLGNIPNPLGEISF